MTSFNYNLEGKTIYVLEYDQPFVNYFAEVIEDRGDYLIVNKLEDDQSSKENHVKISRSQVYDIVE